MEVAHVLGVFFRGFGVFSLGGLGVFALGVLGVFFRGFGCFNNGFTARRLVVRPSAGFEVGQQKPLTPPRNRRPEPTNVFKGSANAADLVERQTYTELLRHVLDSFPNQGYL